MHTENSMNLGLVQPVRSYKILDPMSFPRHSVPLSMEQITCLARYTVPHPVVSLLALAAGSYQNMLREVIL
jgi:hypothetical protein